MMRNLFIVVLVILFFIPRVHSQTFTGGEIPIDYNSPKDYIIGGITVSGVKYLDQNVLVMISGLTVGDKIKIPGEKVTAAIKKLWEQGLFEDISISVTKIEDNTIYLNLYLKERARLSRFSFSGISKSDADNIREKIKIVKGEYVTDNLLVKTTNIILKYYQDKGYLNAKVNIIQRKDTTAANEVSLQIDIDANGKVKISNITIHNNVSFSVDQVMGAFKKTKEKSVFNPMNDLDQVIYKSVETTAKGDVVEIANVMGEHVDNNIRIRLFKSSKFIQTDYEEDKKGIISKYNSFGYRDARIIKDSISRNEDNTINIDIWVDEGPKYYFRNISWVGNTKYSDMFLGRILRINKGDVYDKEALETAMTYNPNGTDIRSLYMDDGYLFFDVVPVEVNVENDSIDIEIRIREGKQATVNKVTISGNTKTSDFVALREVQTRPGQLFSRDKLIQSQRQLAQLKYFDAEKLNPSVNPNPEDGTVDIDYPVSETSADQIELSGGWGYGRIIGTLGLSLNNFSLKNVLKLSTWKPLPSGDGQKLGIRFQTYGKGYFSYSFSFTEPWVGGKKPLALSLSYVHSRYTNGLAQNNPSYGYFKIDGISVGLGSRLRWPDDFFTLYQSVNFNRYNTKNYSAIFTFGGGNGTYNALSYGIVLSRSSVDVPIYPKTGSEWSVNVELTPPYSLFRGDVDYAAMPYNERFKWVEYYKWKFKGSWYVGLVEKLVLTPRMQFGRLGTYNSELGITPFERFYLGGDGLTGYNNMDGRELIGMRGYINNSLTPLYPASVGGTVYAKYTLELRYPVSLNPSATIYGLAFLEAGNDWLLWKNVNPFDVYRSFGFGVRVFLPMFGLLGLDWGYGIDDIRGYPSANHGQFHFSINSSID